MSLAKVGVVVWQPLQSPVVGWFLSRVAVGRESPAVVFVPDHAEISGTLVTGLAAGNAACGSDGGVTCDRERRSIDVCCAELEATGVDVGGRVTARAVAVEGADRDVVPRTRDHGDIRKRTNRWTMAAQAASHALVYTGHRVQCVVTRGGMALGTGCRGRNVVRGLGVAGPIGGEGRRRRMAAVAVAGRRMVLVEGCRWP